MERKITQYEKCNPRAMATKQSETAIEFAFQDMRADILQLHAANRKMAAILRVIAYPKRNTIEEAMDIHAAAEAIQAIFTREELEGI